MFPFCLSRTHCSWAEAFLLLVLPSPMGKPMLPSGAPSFPPGNPCTPEQPWEKTLKWTELSQSFCCMSALKYNRSVLGCVNPPLSGTDLAPCKCFGCLHCHWNFHKGTCWHPLAGPRKGYQEKWYRLTAETCPQPLSLWLGTLKVQPFFRKP